MSRNRTHQNPLTETNCKELYELMEMTAKQAKPRSVCEESKIWLDGALRTSNTILKFVAQNKRMPGIWRLALDNEHFRSELSKSRAEILRDNQSFDLFFYNLFCEHENLSMNHYKLLDVQHNITGIRNNFLHSPVTGIEHILPVEREMQIIRIAGLLKSNPSDESITISLLNLKKLDTSAFRFKHILMKNENSYLDIYGFITPQTGAKIRELIKQLYANLDKPKEEFDRLHDQLDELSVVPKKNGEILMPTHIKQIQSSLGWELHNLSSFGFSLDSLLAKSLEAEKKQLDLSAALFNEIESLEYYYSVDPVAKSAYEVLIKKSDALKAQVRGANHKYARGAEQDTLHAFIAKFISDIKALRVDHMELFLSHFSLILKTMAADHHYLAEPDQRKDAIKKLAQFSTLTSRDQMANTISTIANFAKLDRLVVTNPELFNENNAEPLRQRHAVSILTDMIKLYDKIDSTSLEFDGLFYPLQQRTLTFKTLTEQDLTPKIMPTADVPTVTVLKTPVDQQKKIAPIVSNKINATATDSISYKHYLVTFGIFVVSFAVSLGVVLSGGLAALLGVGLVGLWKAGAILLMTLGLFTTGGLIATVGDICFSRKTEVKAVSKTVHDTHLQVNRVMEKESGTKASLSVSRSHPVDVVVAHKNEASLVPMVNQQTNSRMRNGR